MRRCLYLRERAGQADMLVQPEISCGDGDEERRVGLLLPRLPGEENRRLDVGSFRPARRGVSWSQRSTLVTAGKAQQFFSNTLTERQHFEQFPHFRGA